MRHAMHLFVWLRALSWPALRHQAGRQALAVLAIALGVALSYGVHLLNGAALAEFGSAAASLNGQPDLVLRSQAGTSLREADYAAVANLDGVDHASPVLQGQAQALDAQGRPFNLTVLGLDLLQAGAIQTDLLPRLASPLDGLDPSRIHLNAAALRRLGLSEPMPEGQVLRLRAAAPDSGAVQSLSFQLGAASPDGGPPRAILDIAAAQVLFGRLDQLDRVDLRLAPGLSLVEWRAAQRFGPGLTLSPPPDEGARLGRLTQAYRVNLGVLSLMALFTGSFLVFAVLSLSVAQRLPQWALLGVLGMSARERMALVLMEGLALGLLGSALGLLLGWQLARLGLQLLGSDLGLAAVSGMRPTLRFSAEQLPAAAVFGGLGLAVSLLSAWFPARSVQRMPVAQVLKGLGQRLGGGAPVWLGPALLALGGLLALLPSPTWPAWLAGVPVAAYAAMLAMLAGGMASVPLLLRLNLRALAWPRPSAGLLLMRERARDQAAEASRALAGVLVALSLSVAMLVMVGSFRDSLSQWLSQMLPADLYLRSALRGEGGHQAPLPPELIEAVRQSGQVQRLSLQRSRDVWIDGLAPEQELPALQARELREQDLPLAGPLAAPPAGSQDLTPIYISEALRDSLRLQPGQRSQLRLNPQGPALPVFVRGVWRDYARQSGALLMPLEAYQAWSGDRRITELYLWLPPGADASSRSEALRALAAAPQDLEIAAVGELRSLSLQIFDRSFAVTVWLQAVALAIGLFGIAAAQSAQALARRREFGLLLHLGFRRADVLRLLGLESLLLCGVGALAGLGLGLGLSAVLIWVVNPQSFHWSMDMSLPIARLAALVAAVFVAGVLAAVLAGRQAIGEQAVQAVKEDW